MTKLLREIRAVGRALNAVTGKVATSEQLRNISSCVDQFERSAIDVAARQSAINLVATVQLHSVVLMAKGSNKFVRKVWLNFLYPHRYKIDMLDQFSTEDRKLAPWKPIGFQNFYPQARWSIRANGTDAEFMFRSEDDLVLFKLAVL